MPSRIKHMSDMRGKNDGQLEDMLRERQRELLDLRFNHATGALENPTRLANVKREIARIRTVLNERRTAGAAAE